MTKRTGRGIRKDLMRVNETNENNEISKNCIRKNKIDQGITNLKSRYSKIISNKASNYKTHKKLQ